MNACTLLQHAIFDAQIVVLCLQDYMKLLEDSFNPVAGEKVMCRDTVSVAWDGSMCALPPLLSFRIVTHRQCQQFIFVTCTACLYIISSTLCKSTCSACTESSSVQCVNTSVACVLFFSFTASYLDWLCAATLFVELSMMDITSRAAFI